MNYLTRLIINNMAPEVTSNFHGTETGNYGFTDPGSRTPYVDTEFKRDLPGMIREFKLNPEDFCRKLWENPENEKIKQWFSYVSLQERNDNPELFLKGSYIPLKIKGKWRKNIIAFYRKYRQEDIVVVLPLNTKDLSDGHDWANTRVMLPDFSSIEWENRLNGKIHGSEGILRVNDIFSIFPFAMLRGIKTLHKKEAGILLHISSLPGKFGTGDFGPEAVKFIDYLERTGHSYWQVLPITQTNSEASWSPYSSFSAFAGNSMFIDPNQLAEYGLIKSTRIKGFRTGGGSKADFTHAGRTRKVLLDISYKNFRDSGEAGFKKEFEDYREREKHWLRDFALFLALRENFSNTSWVQWPEKYRDREPEALDSFEMDNQAEVEKNCFIQFIFSKQWEKIKLYANDRGIDIFGDLPIYVGFESADVWSHPHLFELNPDKSMKAIAGVPPDYFNENGQLWDLPVYNWKEMRKEGYDWWIRRIEKNLEWFDLLRLDHFRGFSAYWEVPAGSETAKDGKWVKGPGEDLFNTIKRKFPGMPFVAEDLGDIDKDVYDLRDQFGLPGMRVIQFGFGANMAFQQHNPATYTYNSIVYTGTHDNNTLKGWFNKEADKKTRTRLKDFTGINLRKSQSHIEMIRIAYASVAKLAVIPMQDWLGLDGSARMNYPSTKEGNWIWKLQEMPFDRKLERQIRKMVKTFGRY